jgi:nitrate/TMAO reductase-like tetraheme cytochrome c subunit
MGTKWSNWTVKLFIAILCTLPFVVGACGDNEGLSIDEIMKPETCVTCHPKHFKEWSGSMHAYAADDPVFIAMNKRGQRETNGALGDFCVQCHAPMALRLGLTSNGLNMAEVPQWAKGVTCYFCHNAKSVEGTHNAPIVLFNDAVMRGGIKNPVANNAHRSEFSGVVDSDSADSSAMCGSCHDIVTQKGVHLERTFEAPINASS